MVLLETYDSARPHLEWNLPSLSPLTSSSHLAALCKSYAPRRRTVYSYIGSSPVAKTLSPIPFQSDEKSEL